MSVAVRMASAGQRFGDPEDPTFKPWVSNFKEF